jgi:NAD(P)-dependent dehydrogenase (short-subunit alcohol dehydrogenase family)
LSCPRIFRALQDIDSPDGSFSPLTQTVKAVHRTALITGGTDGIGKAIARGLARAGHDLIIVGRDPDKGMRALHHLRLTTANENIEFLRADLSLMGEAKRLADIIADRWSVLNRLVHCAGIVWGRRILTKEGIESNFAVNYLSRFALTLPLLPLLSAGGNTNATARIVIVGGAAQIGAVHFDNFNLDGNFSTLRAVGQFSQANDIFAIELARRLSAAQKSPRITVTCLKIGVVKTNIRKEFPAWMKWVVPLLFDPLGRADAGASRGRCFTAIAFAEGRSSLRRFVLKDQELQANQATCPRG